MKQLFLIIFSLFIASNSLYAADDFIKKKHSSIYDTTELQQHNKLVHAKNNKLFNLFEKKVFVKRKRLFPEHFFASGGFPFFLFAFIISAIGAYTIYGLAIGPLLVLAIYFIVKGRKKEVMKSFWGWITGTLVGLGVWILLRVV